MAKPSRTIYLGAISLFLLGVIGQVFLAGMVVVARIAAWETHITLGHLLGLFLLFALISMYTGRMRGEDKRLTWTLFAVYFIQADVVIFMRDTLPIASALHPVFALFDFAIGWVLFRRALTYVQEPKADMSPPVTVDAA